MQPTAQYISALFRASNNIPPASPSVRDSVKIVTRGETIFIHDTLKVPVPKQNVSNYKRMTWKVIR